MTKIFLYNSLSRKKERFHPIDPLNVRMYLCGPTVYDRAHLGNARNVILFDVLFRLLRHVWGPDNITYVRNFTDVDDKINEKARKSGRAISEITAETIKWYLDDMAELGNLEPSHMPCATDYISQMILMIKDLITKGHAYTSDGHVLFSVKSYKDYGALSGRTTDDMIARARIEVASYKRHPMDFILWKPSDENTVGWDSPWGRGRPGWHLECSVMSHELLGETFDIHGGGNDLIFPHHENEIAQSRCSYPNSSFANFWLHNEMLQVDGKKMSKSLGNFFTVRDLLNEGYSGEVIRFVFLSTHYSKPMNWTEAKALEAEKTLRRWRSLADGLGTKNPSKKVLLALADDLNTAGVIAELHALAARGDAAMLKASAQFIGLLGNKKGKREAIPDLSYWKKKFKSARRLALATNDFAEVDRLKTAFNKAGLDVRISRTDVDLIPQAGFNLDQLSNLDKKNESFNS